MKVMSINLNGLRSAMRKGFREWVLEEEPDFCCLQEVRTPLALLSEPQFHLPGYYCHYVEAEKKGYSGVGIYSREKPDTVIERCGIPLGDKEGRYMAFEFPDFSVASLYMPNGTSGDERQNIKYRFMDTFYSFIQKLLKRKKPMIICGDWNIAHKPIDLENWKANQKTSGFLPDERAWLDKLLEHEDEKQRWVDAFRVLNKEEKQYSWWSARSKTAWERNVGWRIDYHMVTPDLKGCVRRVQTYREKQFSDHAPVIIEYA
jgi:exodeoxyribonuclease III